MTFGTDENPDVNIIDDDSSSFEGNIDLSVTRGKQVDSVAKYDAVHQIFESLLAKRPDLLSQIAIEEYGNKLHATFGELNDRANQLARVMMARVTKGREKGVMKTNVDGDLLVALRFLPGMELVVTLLALSKAGLAYVPIAPNWPEGRIRLLLEDSHPIMVVTNAKADLIYKASAQMETAPQIFQVSDLVHEGIIDYHENNDNLPANESCNSRQKFDRLYAVLYTSGSTGKPKGARIVHRALMNRLMWQWTTFPYRDDDICAFKTTLTFVDSVSEIWGPLLQGVKLVVIPNKVTQNVEKFVLAIESAQITRLFAVTSLVRNILAYLQMMSKNGKDRCLLKKIYHWECSAEAVTMDLVQDFFNMFTEEDHAISNFYGSTEMMDITYATFRSMRDLDVSENKVPIGRPIFNSVAYVLDENMEPVPVGQIGQLFVSSRNLCDGYVGTKHASFIPNKMENECFDDGISILYRTGDYVKLNHNGQLYYQGRCDSQIKVRGHRVDLSEIEKAVSKVKGVDRNVVLCYKPSEPTQKVLCYFTSLSTDNKNGINAVTLEEKLKEELPEYMIPKAIKLPVIPTLVNGKIDRQSLLNKYEESRKSSYKFTNEDLEGFVCEDQFDRARLLLDTVSQVLSCTEKPKLSDNFFNIGGDSINMVQVISKCNDFGFNMGITEFSLANNLAQIVTNMFMGDATEEHACQLKRLQEMANSDFGYTSENLTLDHREVVVDMISRSFAEKGDLTTLANVTYENISEQVDLLWKSLYAAGLSVVIKNGEKIIGACLNFDARSEEAAPLCACAAFSRNMPDEKDKDNGEDETKEEVAKEKIDDDKVDVVDEVPMSVVEFLDAVEEPLKDQYLPEGQGKIIYASLLGTAADLTPSENVTVTLFMEMENIRYGKAKGYLGIFTTNANRLTQHISRILGYRVLSTIQVNQYEDINGSRPFAEAPDDLVTEVALKMFD